MSLKFFWIPALYPEQAQAELDRFTGTHRVLGTAQEFVQQGSNSGWSIAVDYVEAASAAAFTSAASSRPKLDYQAILDPQTFAVFTALRDKRKELAERDSIPAYAIITNEQMAKLAQMRAKTLEDMKQIEGFGEIRINKYGRELLRSLANVTVGTPEGALPLVAGPEAAATEGQ
jgi:superfamily II DNA helicase RecQ